MMMMMMMMMMLQSSDSCVCVGGLGFEFRVFVAGWRHALRSEWTFTVLLLYYRYMINSVINDGTGIIRS